MSLFLFCYIQWTDKNVVVKVNPYYAQWERTCFSQASDTLTEDTERWLTQKIVSAFDAKISSEAFVKMGKCRLFAKIFGCYNTSQHGKKNTIRFPWIRKEDFSQPYLVLSRTLYDHLLTDILNDYAVRKIKSSCFEKRHLWPICTRQYTEVI
jgi:hypothetical protein